MVTCNAELDGNQPGFGGITGMRIFGGGFLANEPVDIIEREQVAATTKADSFGGYSVHLSVLNGQFPTPHVVRAQGESSGRVSNNAGFTV